MPDGCVRGGGLRFRPSLRIAALGFAIMLPAIKLTVEPVIAEEISLIAILLCICGAGFLITQLAAREGVKKTGWLGVGAKSVLSASALSQLPLSVLYVAGVCAFCHEVGDRQADHRAMASYRHSEFPALGPNSEAGVVALHEKRAACYDGPNLGRKRP